MFEPLKSVLPPSRRASPQAPAAVELSDALSFEHFNLRAEPALFARARRLQKESQFPSLAAALRFLIKEGLARHGH